MPANSKRASVKARSVILAGQLVLPERVETDRAVHLSASRISKIGPLRDIPDDVDIIDARDEIVCPGFVDIHVHGGAGADFMDGTIEAVRTACAAHLRHGTTTIVPTTTTGSHDEIMNMIRACRLVQFESQTLLPDIAGVHLYGPYFAADKVGCHPLDACREPDDTEYDSYFATRMIRVATCAAELPNAAAFYRMAQQHRCLITCGHSNASWSEMQAAFDAGMRHVDHFWCAMSSVPSVRQRLGMPMQGSMNEFVLMNRQMSTEVIADGCHLAPELLEFAYRMKGPKRLCLVTDCNRALDMSPGRYRFGNKSTGTKFKSDGNVGWAPNGSLASSVKGMDHMVRTMLQSTSAPLHDVIRMASLTPAERIGVDANCGSIRINRFADFVILDHDYDVRKVIVRGQVVPLS